MHLTFIFYFLFLASSLAAPAYDWLLDNLPVEERLAYKKLSTERQVTYRQYRGQLMQPHSVKEFIQLFAKMHLEDPDIFSMFKIEFNQEVEKYRGPDAGRQYIQFFFDQIERMSDYSESTFHAHFIQVFNRWGTLDEETKEALRHSTWKLLIVD